MRGIKNLPLLLLFLFSLNLQAGDLEWKILREYDLKTKKLGAKLKKVVGKQVKVVGFMIPLDYSQKELKEFLLVPYTPSCAHVPPPPANQIIKVTMKRKNKVKAIYAPVEVLGTLNVVKKKPKEDPYGMQGVYSMVGNSINKFTPKKKK